MKRPKYIRTFSNDHYDYTKLAVFSALPKPETFYIRFFLFLKSGVYLSLSNVVYFHGHLRGVMGAQRETAPFERFLLFYFLRAFG